MATASQFVHDMPKDTFTEPCMKCFAYVTYDRKEPIFDPGNAQWTLKCPCCGFMMSVSFFDKVLC